MPQTANPPAWADIYPKLDPNMPQDQYDTLRNRYFHDVILPRTHPDDVQQTYTKFRELSERPKTGKQWGEEFGETLGHLATQTAAIAGISAVTGPLSAGLVEALGATGKAATVAAKIGSMGLTFGTYDALQAKDGDRVAAGLKGAMWGSLAEAGIGAVFGFGEKAAHDVVKKTMNNEPVALGAEKATADGLAATVKEAKAKGYTKGPMVESPGKKGLDLSLADKDGNPITHTVPRGTDSKAIGVIEETLAQGGSLDQVTHGPEARARASELMNQVAEKAEAQEETVRVRTEPGQATELAEHLSKTAPATVADDSTVLVQKTEQPITPPDKAPPEPPTDVSKTMFRIGEIRNKLQMEKGGHRPDYAELHKIRGPIASEWGLTREQVGQLGEAHYEQSLTSEVPIDAKPLLDQYAGAGKEFGVVQGEPAPPGDDKSSRLPGFHKALGGIEPTRNESMLWVLDEEGEFRRGPIPAVRLGKSAQELGFRGFTAETEQGPVRFLSKGINRSDAFHENLHGGFYASGLHDRVPDLIHADHLPTARGIAGGLQKSFGAYKGYSFPMMMNEAAVTAMEAVRMNDQPALEQLGKWDLSVDHVKAFVNSTAGRAFEQSTTGDTAAIRQFQRQMNDLVRRTDTMRTAALQRAANTGYTTWFNPEISQWVMRDGEGREVLKKEWHDVMDHLAQADPSSHFPDVAHQFYFKIDGPAGTMVPPGLEPVVGTSTPEIEHVPLGLQAITALRPAMDWFSGVQKKLTRLGLDVDFYVPGRNAETAARDAGRIMDGRVIDKDAILRGVPDARRKDLGELLARPRDQWAEHAKALKLNEKELGVASQLDEWKSGAAPKLTDTLNTLRQIREVGGDLSKVGGDARVIEAVKAGNLGYSDLHVGKVAQWIARQEYEDTMKEPMAELDKLRHQFANNKEISSTIKNYQNYIRGIPDPTQKALDSFAEGFEKATNNRIDQFSKMTGVNIPKMNIGKGFWPMFRLSLFTAGLGGRASMIIRDGYQATYGMIAVGPMAFAEGIAQSFSKEGRALAEESGALLHKRNVSSFFGDVSQDIPAGGRVVDTFNRAANTLLAPSRVGHNIGRRATFLAEYKQSLAAITRHRAGTLDSIGLRDATSAWIHDAPEQGRLLAMAAKPEAELPATEVAKAFALAANEATQFGGSPGTALRTGVGRILGQYASWPMNHIEFTRKLASRAIDNPKKGIPAFALWAAMNYGAAVAAESVGIDATKWLFASPAGWTGSPTLELAGNLMAAPEESDKGRKARHDIMTFPLELIPTGVELRNIYQAIDTGDVSIPKLMGFKELKDDPQKDRDLDDWLQYESGFKRK